MIVTGRYDRTLRDESTSIVSFSISNYLANHMELERDVDYKLEITKVKSKRSLAQNRLIWELIGKIAQSENGNGDTDYVYCQIIKLAGIKTVYVQTVPQAKADLLKAFRVVIDKDSRVSEKGVETIVMECYYGTSTFDQEEMSKFIDCLLNYAAEMNIDTREYQGYR